MNPYFSRQEGVAVLCLLGNVAMADELTMGEDELAGLIAQKLGFANPRDLHAMFEQLTLDSVISVISRMNYEKRKLVTCMLLLMVFHDGVLTEEEKDVYPEIVSQCNLIFDENISPQEANYIVSNWLNS